MFYYDCRHGFGVLSWGPRVLWQAVTLWLVNRGVAVHQSRPVEQVRNRKGTTWDENHAVRIESRARDTQPIRGVRSSLTIRLSRGCKRWHPLAPGKRFGGRRSLLSEYMSLQLSLKLTINCVPFSRIKWVREIFIKNCVSFGSLKFVHYLQICSWLGLREVYNIWALAKCLKRKQDGKYIRILCAFLNNHERRRLQNSSCTITNFRNHLN